MRLSGELIVPSRMVLTCPCRYLPFSTRPIPGEMLDCRCCCSYISPACSFSDHEVVCGDPLERVHRRVQSLKDRAEIQIPGACLRLKIRRRLWPLCEVDIKASSFQISCSSRPRKVVIIALLWRRAHQVQHQR